jgi:hypothetical protein
MSNLFPNIDWRFVTYATSCGVVFMAALTVVAV